MSKTAAGAEPWLGRPSSSALLLSSLGLVLLWLTWRTWPDPLVDFGRELYVPWRLSEGARLYRDIAYFNGPLSPWVNATLFRLFGVSLMTLVTFNLLVLAGVTAMLWTVIRRITDGVTALVASTVFLCVSGFGHGGVPGNFNFVAPYSHEATHGFALALLGLLLACRSGERNRTWPALAAGICAALAIMTKPEMGLAALAATASPLFVGYWRGNRTLLPTAAYLIGVVIPLAAAAGTLAGYLPAKEAILHVFGGWNMAMDRRVTGLYFYRRQAGLDAPIRNIILMLLCGAAYASVAGLIALASRASGLRALNTGAKPLIIGIAVFDASYVTFVHVLPDAGRALPLVAVGGILVALTRLRHRSSPLSPAVGALLGFSTMAAVLLLKMSLRAMVGGYGFVLAAPALALAVAAIVGSAMAMDERRGRLRRSRVAMSVGLVLSLPGVALSATVRSQARPYVVGRGADAILADTVRGPVLDTISVALDGVPSGSTLAVLPEGVTLNYLYRLRNPTPFINFMPPEVLHYHQRRMVAAFRAAPPGYVLFLQRRMPEYGLPVFGKDYAQQLVAWIDTHYHPVLRVGDTPFQPGSGYGALLLERDGRSP